MPSSKSMPSSETQGSWPPRIAYERAPKQIGDFEAEEEIATLHRQRPISGITAWLLTLVNVSAAVAAIFTSIRSSYLCPTDPVDDRYRHQDFNTLAKKTSAYSPLLDEVDIALSRHTFNGLIHDNTSIYRGKPSPEVDEAWDFFSGDVFTLPSFALTQNGKDLFGSVKAPTSWNRGNDAYLVQIDVFHQIHCLNSLRMDLSWEYYHGNTNPSETWLEHRAHCLHILLQSLMCHADVDIVSFDWMSRNNAKAVPEPNFNVIKQCRDFDAIVEWAERNKVPDAHEKRKKLFAPDNAHVKSWDDV